MSLSGGIARFRGNAAGRLTTATMMGVTDTPDSPEALLRMLLGHPGESFEDRLRQELAKQTFVGGKRVVKQKLPKLPKHAETTVHVVKVTLHGAKPPVWRRLEIPSAMTLDLMHGVMLAAFGWHGYHLHVGHGDTGAAELAYRIGIDWIVQDCPSHVCARFTSLPVLSRCVPTASQKMAETHEIALSELKVAPGGLTACCNCQAWPFQPSARALGSFDVTSTSK